MGREERRKAALRAKVAAALKAQPVRTRDPESAWARIKRLAGPRLAPPLGQTGDSYAATTGAVEE